MLVEAPSVNKQYFEDAFPEEVWSSTYKDHNDINVASTWDRVAKSLSSVEDTFELKEKYHKEFFDALERF